MKIKLYLTLLAAISAIGSFVLISQLAIEHQEIIRSLVITAGPLAALAYVVLSATAIVVAPLGFGFLIPVAAQAFGPFLAAVYSVLGWVIGSVLVWIIFRKYARPHIRHLTFIKYIEDTETRLSKRQWYTLVLLMRIVLPVDVVSYALVLGSSIRFLPYLISTVAGISPFAFLSTYAAVGSWQEQIIVASLGTGLFVAGGFYFYKKI